jgi:hypothetical protein
MSGSAEIWYLHFLIQDTNSRTLPFEPSLSGIDVGASCMSGSSRTRLFYLEIRPTSYSVEGLRSVVKDSTSSVRSRVPPF